MFPGQGSQYIGMGKEFYDTFSVAKEVFDKASEVTGLDIAKLCFEENFIINLINNKFGKFVLNKAIKFMQTDMINEFETLLNNDINSI